MTDPVENDPGGAGELRSEEPAARARPFGRGERVSFGEDFRRFFVRGLAALLPTLITVWLLYKAYDFLWDSFGRHLLRLVKYVHFYSTQPWSQWGDVDRFWEIRHPYLGAVVGVGLAVVLIYIVGLLVGNLIGRTFWKLGETLLMKIPIIRAIYPAVKQVTDFVLQEKRQIESSRVVAVQPHEKGIWSIGLVTGQGWRALNQATGGEMVSVFVPSSPTAFSGYVLIVPREQVVELPVTVEEAMRLLVSGGVIIPREIGGAAAGGAAAGGAAAGGAAGGGAAAGGAGAAESKSAALPEPGGRPASSREPQPSAPFTAA